MPEAKSYSNIPYAENRTKPLDFLSKAANVFEGNTGSLNSGENSRALSQKTRKNLRSFQV